MRLKRQAGKPIKSNKVEVKRHLNISWWKLTVAAFATLIGLAGLIQYISDIRNVFAGLMLAVGLGTAGFFTYWGIAGFSQKYIFNTGRKQYTGKENALMILATRNSKGKDVPHGIYFAQINNPPKGARLHYQRNFRRHMYEVYNDNTPKALREGPKLKPVSLPDKKPFSPAEGALAAAMQEVKDWYEYNPPTLMQQLTPGIIFVAIIIIGILEVMTLGSGS